MTGNPKPYLLLTGAAASWGIATVISKQAITEISPLALLPIQLAVSVGLLGIVMAITGSQFERTNATRRLALLGFLNPGLSYALGLAGLAQITASLSAVLWATEPLIILALAAWLLHESITRPFAYALAIATTGVVLVAADAATAGSTVGVALSLAGVMACAVYTVVARKWIGDDSTLAIITAQQLCALVFSIAVVVVAQLIGYEIELSGWSTTAWASAIVSGVLYYGLAFWFYLRGLQRTPATIAGLFLTLVPLFGVGAGYLALGERLSSLQSIGALMIVVTVGAVMWSRSRSIPLTAESPSIIVDYR